MTKRNKIKDFSTAKTWFHTILHTSISTSYTSFQQHFTL